MLSSYPSSAFADDALLWKGKSLQRQASIQLLARNTAGATALFTQARAAYQSVITTYPNTIPTLIPESNYQIGVSYFDEKNYAVARSTLLAVLANYPTSTIADGAQYHLARSIHELARVVPPTTYTFAQARTEYAKLMTTYPASIWIDNAQYQIGKTYFDELNYVTAIAEFNKVFANYPASTIADSAQYYLARSMHALALATTPTYTLTQARTAYAKLFTSYPASTLVDNAQYQIGKTYYDELNYATAITEFNLVLINYPVSSIADEAQYYKARSTHALALSPTSGYTFANARAEYARVISNYPASIFADNASYRSAYTYHDATQCTPGLTAMQAFVLKYSMSPMSTLLVATANTHISDLVLVPPVTHTPCF